MYLCFREGALLLEEEPVSSSTVVHNITAVRRKNISLEESAYNLLKAAKGSGETFSDVVRRLAGQRTPSLLEFATLFEPEVGDRVAEVLRQMDVEDIQLQRMDLDFQVDYEKP